MNRLIIYLLEINEILLVLYAAYRLFFEKDRNFFIRRIFLLGIPALSLLLPLVPDTIRAAAGRLAPVAIQLEEITIYANTPVQAASGSWFSWSILCYLYLLIFVLGLLRLGIQLTGIIAEARLGNPHGVLVIDADGDRWTVEVGQPWRNERAGLKDGDLAPGNEIKVEGEPSANIEDRRLKVERLWLDGSKYELYPNRN